MFRQTHSVNNLVGFIKTTLYCNLYKNNKPQKGNSAVTPRSILLLEKARRDMAEVEAPLTTVLIITRSLERGASIKSTYQLPGISRYPGESCVVQG